ncbi:DUF937 domain-containing protein [Sphingobacterium cellulitidis]|uniref:DUF937 domain-containing protein n=1 Tax=Sphingobacterium cellulitidis TaxID=1768011 RepID=UPI000B93B8F8|nr:DUF937 domain-containing protein [Sphingobacterium cellulitidis]OYD47657.1 hypothetical protein CHU00_01955 [Sphingobacterium cellulitidis]
MNISDLISGSIGSQATEGISEKLGLDKNQTQWVVSAAIPLMMSALNYNAQKSPEQAQGIQNALDSHSGGIFDNLAGLFNQGPTEDEDKIVNHIFGKNTETVKQSLSEKSGISMGKIGGILALLAPLVMGYLGKKKQSDGGSSGGIGDLLGSILGGGSSNAGASGGGIGDLIGSVLGAGSSNSTGNAQPNIAGGLGDLVGQFFDQKNDNNAKGSILDSLAGMFGK